MLGFQADRCSDAVWQRDKMRQRYNKASILSVTDLQIMKSLALFTARKAEKLLNTKTKQTGCIVIHEHSHLSLKTQAANTVCASVKMSFSCLRWQKRERKKNSPWLLKMKQSKPHWQLYRRKQHANQMQAIIKLSNNSLCFKTLFKTTWTNFSFKMSTCQYPLLRQSSIHSFMTAWYVSRSIETSLCSGSSMLHSSSSPLSSELRLVVCLR